MEAAKDRSSFSCIKFPIVGVPTDPGNPDCNPHWKLVDLLLENNADTTIKNKRGQTAAMMANADLSDYLNGGVLHVKPQPDNVVDHVINTVIHPIRVLQSMPEAVSINFFQLFGKLYINLYSLLYIFVMGSYELVYFISNFGSNA